MPYYLFRCTKKKCQHEFEEMFTFSEFDQGCPKAKCPKCGKKKPDRLIAMAHFGNNPDKMNNFEFAAQKNFDRATQESSNARDEAKKKGIKSPYADLPDFTENGKRMNFIE